MGEKVLLAGCGDLGLRVAKLLLQRGDEVWALRRVPPAHSDDGIHWIGADLTKPETLRRLPIDLTQLVYLPAPDRRDACTYGALFADGLRNLLVAEGLATLQRVLLVSSSAVYGDYAGAWVDEDTPTAPLAFNGTLLRDVEQWLALQPVHSIVLRLAGIYGPGRLQLLERLRTGSVRVPRATPHWANRVHVDDAAAAVAHLLQLADPLLLYLGVDDTPLPLDVLYDYLAGLIDAPLPEDGPAPAGVGSKRLSNARLRASGWAPRWLDARAGYAELVRSRGDVR